MSDSMFSYLNATIYRITLHPNLDFRIAIIPAIPGSAMIYFTDATIPLNVSNIIPPDSQFTIIDS
ncbi:6617_t:CDS:2 [Funneliformis caledonium]|uniref:6617_t:CDS:1 n=1 Tax=Funneliformis caledonium TaxID=1117310 RepID=A0A9N9IWL9_9GLOM|nr:6617_t:CDS:2 [Funneliformis caledonium]